MKHRFLAGMPDIPVMSNIGDLFANFNKNWSTLTPVLSLLFGTLLGFFFIGLLVKLYRDEH